MGRFHQMPDLARVLSARVREFVPDILTIRLRSTTWAVRGRRARRRDRRVWIVILPREHADRVGVRRALSRLTVPGDLTGERRTGTYARHRSGASRHGKDSPNIHIYLPHIGRRHRSASPARPYSGAHPFTRGRGSRFASRTRCTVVEVVQEPSQVCLGVGHQAACSVLLCQPDEWLAARVGFATPAGSAPTRRLNKFPDGTAAFPSRRATSRREDGAAAARSSRR
jgi:hypothetical protein